MKQLFLPRHLALVPLLFGLLLLATLTSFAFPTSLPAPKALNSSGSKQQRLAGQPFRVLVFHKTNGFRHASLDEGIAMIEELGQQSQAWTTDHSDDAGVFTAANLARYAVVVWCNTSGDDLLNGDQQAAFENYIRVGGGFVGIHAATDTYRSGSWPWYNQLVGGIVQTDPNHTAADFQQTMDVVAAHPTTNFLGNSWTKTEEYYYWAQNGGYLYPGNINLLQVRATGDNSYDAARPIAWYKAFDGGRSFYTALGHAESDYQNDNLFRTHVQQGIIWAAGPPPTEEAVARINCGGETEQTSAGTVFVADQYFTGGQAFTNPAITDITDTDDDALYRSERSAGTEFGSFSYQIPVAPGTYTVRLHFAEVYYGATNGGPGGNGRRVFSITAEGTPALVDYDITAAVGPMRAVVRAFDVPVQDGELTLTFSAQVDQPSIAAIEVLKTAATAPVLAINAGGETYSDEAGRRFERDQSFRGGYGFQTSNAIAGTDDDPLYQTERYGNFTYALALPNGTYQVTFKFAEIFFAAPGQRVFDVVAEGQEVISDLDIYAQAGLNAALDVPRTVTVTDGELTLDFRSQVDQAKLSALLIELVASANTLAVTTAIEKRVRGEIYPNPVTSADAYLRFARATPQPARVQLLNQYGAVVWNTTIHTQKGNNEVKLRTQQLKPGLYLLKLYLPGETISEKIVVTE